MNQQHLDLQEKGKVDCPSRPESHSLHAVSKQSVATRSNGKFLSFSRTPGVLIGFFLVAHNAGMTWHISSRVSFSQS